MLAGSRALRFTAGAFVVAGGLIVASCGGGSVATTPQTAATVAPSTTQAVPTSGGTLALPGANAQIPSFSIAAGAPGGVTLTATSSTTAPGNAPAPSSVARKTEAKTGAVPFFFVTFTVSANMSTQYIASEAITLASANPSTASYYAEFDDITSTPVTLLASAGPGTIANGIATIANSFTSAPTLQTGHTYLLQFYYVPAAGASPTPTATATATPTATPTASATPTSTTTTVPIVPAPAASSGQKISVSNGGYTINVFLGGYTPAQSTTVTATLSATLPTGITTASLLSGASVLGALTMTSPITITGTNTNCGGCTYQTQAGTVTIPSTVVSSLAGKTVYSEECVGTTCNPNSYDIIAMQQSGTTLTFPSPSFPDFTGTGTTPISFLLYAVASPAPAPSASASATGTIAQGPVVFPSAGPYGTTFTFASAPSPTTGSASVAGYTYAPPTAIPSLPPNTSPTPSAGVTATVIAAWTFTPALSMTIPSPATVVTGLPVPAFGKKYYTFFADITAGQASGGYGSGATFNGLTGTLTSLAPGGTTPITAGHTYIYEVVSF